MTDDRAARIYAVAQNLLVEFAALATQTTPHLPEAARAEYAAHVGKLVGEAKAALGEATRPEPEPASVVDSDGNELIWQPIYDRYGVRDYAEETSLEEAVAYLWGGEETSQHYGVDIRRPDGTLVGDAETRRLIDEYQPNRYGADRKAIPK